MDNVDKKILEILQKNARTPNTEIAKQLDMVPSAILERIRKLENTQRGEVIKGYKAIINPASLNLHLLAFIKIKCSEANWSQKCGQQLKDIPNIEELHEVLGEDSYLAKIRVKDMTEMSKLLKENIGTIKGISETQTIMVINTLKENGNFPISKNND